MSAAPDGEARPRERVTRALAQRILSGDIPPGEKLPNEADLGAQMAVSRTALRESIRMLAGKGLVESRTRAGTIVLPPTHWNQLDPDLLAWREALPPDYAFVRALTEAREVIEPAAAALAARRATARDLARIEAAYEAMQAAGGADIDASVQADEAFHRAILVASHNAVFANFGAVIGSALRNSFRLTTSASENYALTLEKHGDVLEAIRLRRDEGARALMGDLIGIAIRDLAKLSADGNADMPDG
ncbi:MULTISPECIES: FadR/GntR family transcriptional regulator [unclassified Roseitalea]|uniref:FadR/GntR family transcriptional regulator n=1 Tax=unclassified Roseitalea TaxID=2639107 RepID=UPI00274019A1|nr:MULTISPECIES: FadR/GntR family transcriptional regulator [unclassified Roseitalea]